MKLRSTITILSSFLICHSLHAEEVTPKSDIPKNTIEVYCSNKGISTFEIENGKGSLKMKDTNGILKATIEINSLSAANIPSQSSKESQWGKPVEKTEAYAATVKLNDEKLEKNVGLLKFYFKDKDVALVFVVGEFHNIDLGTQFACPEPKKI